MSMYKDVTVQLKNEPTKLIHIYEGDGSNLSAEDEDEGYVDYVMVDMLEYDEGELDNFDGGQMMLTKPFDEMYPKENITVLISDSLQFVGYVDVPEYTIIQSNY